MKYSEDTLLQQTPAEYLEQGRDWESGYAYNNEDFGPESLLVREFDHEVVIPRTLRAKTEALNHGLPATDYDLSKQVVDLMKAGGYPGFSIHYHTQLWQSQDAKNPANGYGTMVAGKVWHWYERWVDVVRKHCRDSGGKYA